MTMTPANETKTLNAAPRARAEGSVSKALAVLDILAQAATPLRFTALLAQTPYPKATLHRMLRRLTEERMLVFDAVSQTYTVGPRLIAMAYASWNKSGLVEAASPILDQLTATIDESLDLAQLDGGQVLYLDRRSKSVAVPTFSGAGKVGPAYCTAIGKAMLAFLSPDSLDDVLAKQAFHRFTPNTIADGAALSDELEAIRAGGIAFEREEHEYGVIGIAVPIRLPDGPLYGALSMTGSLFHTALEDLEVRIPAMKAAAANIAREAQMRMTPALR